MTKRHYDCIVKGIQIDVLHITNCLYIFIRTCVYGSFRVKIQKPAGYDATTTLSISITKWFKHLSTPFSLIFSVCLCLFISAWWHFLTCVTMWFWYLLVFSISQVLRWSFVYCLYTIKYKTFLWIFKLMYFKINYKGVPLKYWKISK